MVRRTTVDRLIRSACKILREDRADRVLDRIEFATPSLVFEGGLHRAGHRHRELGGHGNDTVRRAARRSLRLYTYTSLDISGCLWTPGRRREACQAVSTTPASRSSEQTTVDNLDIQRSRAS